LHSSGDEKMTNAMKTGSAKVIAFPYLVR